MLRLVGCFSLPVGTSKYLHQRVVGRGRWYNETMSMVNVEEFFRHLPDGYALCSNIKIENSDYAAFMIKAHKDWRIDGVNILIQMRLAIFDYKTVAPVVWMAKVFNDVFETYVNWADEGGRAILANLSRQPIIPVLLYRGPQIARKLSISNSLSEAAKLFTALLAGRTWSDRDFNLAKQRIYREFGDVEALWRSLGQGQDRGHHQSL